MTKEEYRLARLALFCGQRVVFAITPAGQRFRIYQLRRKNGRIEGKYINDGYWYLVGKVEIQ